MGFAVDGRYVLAPVEATDGQKYVDLQLTCLDETYRDIIDPGFGARQRAVRDGLLEEFEQNMAAPGVRAFFAYENPAWQPGAPLACSVGGQVGWDAPVGFALSRPGPLPWELEVPLPPAAEGTRELTHLYTLAKTHGTGLGAALFDAVLYEGEQAYLWYILGNERALAFYGRRGFEVEGTPIDCGGAWSPGRTGRMFRGF
ncbi:MAG: N-acetyltransferase [Rothia sp. (in: high G+C Gram-positive bacteria)]|nr:N-acetyltransferase [Rothia sp. (in: high G+C Gram-positive bacteria)]